MKFPFSIDVKKVILSLAVIFLVFILTWLGRAGREPAVVEPPAAESPAAIEIFKTPAEITAEYNRQRQDIINRLLPYLSKQLDQDEITPLTQLSDELVALAVPREQQPTHLRLVLKLSLLIDLLSPQRVKIATGSWPSVNQVQSQLKQLISEQSIDLVN